MRRLFLLGPITLALFLLSGCAVKLPVAGHNPRTSFGKATGPDGWEQAFWGAVKSKDWVGVERHLSSNYVFVTSSGRFDKAQFLAALRRFDLDSFEISDFQTKPEGNNFVLTYTLTINGTLDGKPIANPVTRMLSVWQVQKRGELQIAMSESAISK